MKMNVVTGTVVGQASMKTIVAHGPMFKEDENTLPYRFVLIKDSDKYSVHREVFDDTVKDVTQEFGPQNSHYTDGLYFNDMGNAYKAFIKRLDRQHNRLEMIACLSGERDLRGHHD